MLLRHLHLKFLLLISLICASCIYVILYGFRSQYSVFQKPKEFSFSRIFIFTSDNRPLEHNLNQFYTLSMLINFVYARRYKYTYRYFQITYNDTRQLAKNIPFRPSCFNHVLNQERSVHWAKLQVLWYVLETYASTHDVFLYLDSDAVINDHDLSLSKFLSNLSWAKPSKCKEFNINSCHVAFAYDTWNKNDSFVVPNSGIYLFQATPQFRQFLQVWWHLNMHESNFFGFYEQDSLWNLLENIPSPAARRPTTAQLAARQEWNNKVKEILHRRNLTHYIGILDMKTFGNTNQSQFLVHMTSGLGPRHRQPELLRIWQRIKGTLNDDQLLTEAEQQCVVRFDATNDRIPWNIST